MTLYVTAKKPGYKVQFKVMAAQFKFSQYLKTISNCLVIFFVSSKKIGQWSLETFESAATKKHYLAKAKISFRFKQVFYYFI